MILGLCYILPFKQPKTIHMHTFLSLFVFLLCIFLLPKTEQIFVFKPAQAKFFFIFVGITILFSIKPARLSWATVYWQYGLDRYSGQSESRKSRLKLHFWMLRWQSEKVWSLGPIWTYDPVRVCVFLSIYVFVKLKCPVLHLYPIEFPAINKWANAKTVSAGLCAFCNLKCALANPQKTCI